MIELTSKDIERCFNLSESLSEFRFSGVSTDTRTLEKGNLFIAIVGENFDGHEFCEQAVEKGAAAVVVSQPVNVSAPVIEVSDTVQAFGQLARFWRERLDINVIAVTGSNGKTTTKNMIASIMQAAADSPEQVSATKGNFNNHIGLPHTLCRLNDEHRYAVIEMGMNHFGEIEYLTKLVEPNVAIINNVAACHTEGVGDIQGVAKAKSEIFLGLVDDGVAVLNADDDFFEYCRSQATPKTVKSFAVEAPANVIAGDIDLFADHAEFLLSTTEEGVAISLGLPGIHNVYNALAAATACLQIGISLQTIQQGLGDVKAEKHRLNFLKGLNDVLLIDDTYNANPASLLKAISVLKKQPGRHILVMGDLGELGKDAEKTHAELGEQLREMGVDCLYTLGTLTENTANKFGDNANHFTDKQLLINSLTNECNADTTILLKASRSMKLEEVVDQLKV